MSAREEILARIRRARDPHAADLGETAPLREGLAALPSIRPSLDEDPLQRFVRKAEAVGATVERLGVKEVPRAVAAYLTQHALGPAVSLGEDRWLRGLSWAEEGIDLAPGTPGEIGAAGISRAAFAIAETGTLALVSGPDNPMMLNFLPDHHIVVVETDRLVSHQEEVLEILRARGLPRSLVFVTGPSRTGDIEFTIQLGAHGPRHLHVIVVVGSADDAG